MQLFGRAKKQQPASAKDTIVRLRENLDLLEKREKYLQTKIDNEVITAKANLSKNKRAALMALKRKRVYEGQVEKIMGARMTIETQVMTIENANVNLEAMNAMKAGAEAMKKIHGAMDINTVDNTMDDIREQMDLANEISDAISQPVGFGQEMDEDELTAELEQLEQEELDSKLLDAQPVPQRTPASPTTITGLINKLPGVPKTEPVIAQPPRPLRQQIAEDEDAELAELRASMAM